MNSKIYPVVLTLSLALFCTGTLLGNYPPLYKLTEYPPKLIHTKVDDESLQEKKSSKGDLTAFVYVQLRDIAILGMVDASNSILWQKATKSRSDYDFFWSSDGRFVLFVTDNVYHGDKIDLYAKEGNNYIYVFEAKTGKIVYEINPDIKLLHLDKIPDPRKWRPSLAGGTSVDNIDLVGNKLTVTESVYSPGGAPKTMPNGTPISDILPRAYTGSIVIPNLPPPSK
jgi:hypothetical protein